MDLIIFCHDESYLLKLKSWFSRQTRSSKKIYQQIKIVWQKHWWNYLKNAKTTRIAKKCYCGDNHGDDEKVSYKIFENSYVWFKNAIIIAICDAYNRKLRLRQFTRGGLVPPKLWLFTPPQNWSSWGATIKLKIFAALRHNLCIFDNFA